MKNFINKIINFRTPNNVIKIANSLCFFIQSENQNYKNVYVDIYNSKNDLNLNITSICGIPIDNTLQPRILGLYYNKKTKLIMFDFINPCNISKETQDFLYWIFTKYSVSVKNYKNSLTLGKRIWININDSNKIISELSKEKFKLYTSTTKFNV